MCMNVSRRGWDINLIGITNVLLHYSTLLKLIALHTI